MRLAQRIVSVALTAMVAVPLLGSAPAQAHSTSTTTTATTLSASDVYENRLLALTNAARKARGLRTLTKSSCATTISGRYAYRLAQLGRLVHNDMYRVAVTCNATAAGENIAYGNVSADKMFAMWMASPAHKANLLRKDWTTMGMGAYRTSSGRWYGVQNFLRRP